MNQIALSSGTDVLSAHGRTRRRLVLLGLVSPLLAACGASTPSPTVGQHATGTASLSGAAGSAAATASGGTSGAGPTNKVALVFPGPGTLIFLPFEVARAEGFFQGQGLDVSFTYAKGGPPAVTALLAKSTDFVGTTIDLALNSYKQHKTITMIASLTRVPAFAVVGLAPEIMTIKDLAGKTVAITNVGAGDQLVLEYLLKKAGVDPKALQYVAVGPDEAKLNALKAKQVNAAILQEPALSIVMKEGGHVLANLYDPKEAQAAFGGGYQFTGLVTRPDVISDRAALAQRITTAVVQADRFIASHAGADIAAKLPAVAITGGDRSAFALILDATKQAVFSPDGRIRPADVDNVAKVQAASGALTGETPDMSQFFTNRFVDAAVR